MEKQTYRFSNEISTIEVKSLGAKITIKSHDEKEILAEYSNPKDKPEFSAVLKGNTLTLKENACFEIFCSKPTEEYTLDVYLPKKLYSEIKVDTASGGADVAGVSAEKFSLKTASGDISVNGDFGNIAIKSASGNITLGNEKTAKSLEVCTVSGSVEVNAKAEQYSVSSVSGTTKLNSAEGEGKVNITSGNVTLDYANWNADLQISLVSGNAEVYLPEGSGFDVDFNGISGSLKTDFGNEKGKVMNLGVGTSGHFGGENSHKVTISATSGTVKVLQK